MSPWLGAWRRRLASLAADEYRRELNARGTGMDSTAWALLAICLPIVSCKAVHQPGLLVLGGCNMLLVLGIWLLLKQQRGTYIAYREALLTLGYAPIVLFAAVQHSFTRHLQFHSGSSLRLLPLLLVVHPGCWGCIGALYGGVWVGNRGMCHQLLQVPEIEEPLGRLHWAVSLIHNGMLPTLFSGVNPPLEPMQQCLIFNAWMTVALGALLPLFLQSRLEAAARRRFDARYPPLAGSSERNSMCLEVHQMEWSSLYFFSFVCWLLADAAYTVPDHLVHPLRKLVSS
ncbi:heavy metal tolerance [Chlorella sorokiniana]|uniref:Heavy metal tolerance n=1 Tax=Chlorella sorokiniana TaxID=3076 RepID=A0A2P6TLM2_CHLSO|nr:heavy metal tolerance [Chlorella sorokiniana]|eukprot:PRW45180.1 heavy metal tolerance [Chlorella sorokiniana]